MLNGFLKVIIPDNSDSAVKTILLCTLAN